ncbi:hypothetical protein LPJ72_002825, partial [Coemansia sp. Benny D160-2]
MALAPAQQQHQSPPQPLSQIPPSAPPSLECSTLQAAQPVAPYTSRQYSGNPHMHPQSAGAAPRERQTFQPSYSQQQSS